MILTRTYDAPPVSEQAILRYAGCREATEEIRAVLADCIAESADALEYKVCYTELPLTVTGNVCDFGVLSVTSEKLADHLRGCHRAVLFAATVGVTFDRLIARYGRVSPARAMLLQAFGAERIEALCDAFCGDLAKMADLRPRFSPGYGDLPLTVQRDIFPVLDCARKIGLTLNDSCLMSPSKSVTAFVGLCDPTAEISGGVV
ncbi:MAG: Vitamin B12 dependent methionine synthase activation subunit [Clostridia bacterium]|nr:Vitamin B12 dependent methionine synthase activation subunit [Clostridia bacterium]